MTSNRVTSTAQWLDRIRAEFAESPGLRLTRAEMRRLWGLDDATCDELLTLLVQDHFLKRTPKDGYVRAA